MIVQMCEMCCHQTVETTVIALGLLSTSFSLRPIQPFSSAEHNRSEPLNDNMEVEKQVPAKFVEVQEITWASCRPHISLHTHTQFTLHSVQTMITIHH
jgi:hypothetical protein